ncbi:MAG: aminotransferase class V-fold PLP-dependent enzyme [Bryobacter sp.]|nr:aminotransferase class V-fold PLP-dependent enzyme [Bryobacter sp.]
MSFDREREFPVVKSLLYLNHAAVAPLPRVAGEAIQRFATDAMEFGSLHYGEWMQACERVRTGAAQLIGASSREIALIKNTSEGIATVQMGLAWRPGDVVVAFREEFPANYYCWKLLEERQGCTVRWLSIYDPLEEIEKAARGARLLAISWVNYLSGHRVDLQAIGDICRRHNVFYFVDAIQGMGAFPLDVKRCGIHALAADGHKWMLGPEGWGVLYVDHAVQDEIFPVEFGWTTVKNWADYASRDMTLRPDAGRYEPGTLNVVGSFALAASLELLLARGLPTISQEVLALSRRLAEGLSARGFELMRPWEPSTASGIVSCRREGADSNRLVAELKSRNILAAPRQGWVRLSPHFYQSEQEMDHLVDTLASLA